MVREYSPGCRVEVPLNIMCSRTCATPVAPFTSSMLPTRYQAMTTATGARRSVLTMMRRPLASLCSAVSSAARHGTVASISAINAQHRCLEEIKGLYSVAVGFGLELYLLAGRIGELSRRGSRISHPLLDCSTLVKFPQTFPCEWRQLACAPAGRAFQDPRTTWKSPHRAVRRGAPARRVVLRGAGNGTNRSRCRSDGNRSSAR